MSVGAKYNGAQCPECGSSDVSCSVYERKAKCNSCGETWYAMQCTQGGCYRGVMSTDTLYCPEHDSEVNRSLSTYIWDRRSLDQKMKEDSKRADLWFKTELEKCKKRRE